MAKRQTIRPWPPHAALRIVPLLLAAGLFAASGCGQPSGESGAGTTTTRPGAATTGSGSTGARMSMEGTYEDTGLPKKLEMGGKSWELQQDIDTPEGSYEKGSEQVHGKPVYHDPGAKPPYSVIYLKVGGKGRYLQYAPTGR